MRTSVGLDFLADDGPVEASTSMEATSALSTDSTGSEITKVSFWFVPVLTSSTTYHYLLVLEAFASSFWLIYL